MVLDKPVVMGILNLTPDSFYSGSRYEDMSRLLHKAELMLNDGATILDIGGQSTRPGSKQISMEEEMKRVIEPIRKLSKKFPDAILSIDTFYSSVAKAAVEEGVSIINDISAGSMDEEMISVVSRLSVPYILMHMKGTPLTMQENTSYTDITKEVLEFFIDKLSRLRESGIHDVIIDPGFGFGKNITQNFELLRNLSLLKILERPILAGLSRKSSIYKTLGVSVEEALNGTTVLNTLALNQGAQILRVHDVREATEAIKLFQAYSGK